MTEWIEHPAPYDHNLSLQENRKRSRGTLRCACGQPVSLGAALWGPDYCATCNGCDRCYNLCGQELIPRAQWEPESPYDD